MMMRLPLVGVLALALSAVALPAAAQQDGGLFGNIFKPPAATPQPLPGGDETELVGRMERLESSLRQLTGQVEQLQYRNQQLEAQVRRLEEGAGGARGPAAASAPALAPAATPPSGRPVSVPGGPGKRSDAFDPNADPAAPGAPQPLGSPASAATALPRPAEAIPGGRPAGGTQVAALPGSGASVRELYDAGQAQLQRQDYSGAEQTFRQIIQSASGDRIIPDATFMLGESLFLRQNYGDAAASFLEVSTKYPNSPRAPEALLRLGQSLAGLGEKETACATLQEVDRKYPRATSSIRQAVEREQKRVGC
ncbi:tol-pal system protein YbgF [Xanthobacter autotrophicus]|uniref:tol-pal system protein YbgF n=1 Tax=Xanthobacter autotrophicus TaxID=280 RepID=UPI00372AE2A0